MSEPRRHTHPVLRRADLSPDPIEQFGRWYDAARDSVPLAEAMTLATVGPDGAPDARMVLLKGHDSDGFRFFTNYGSAKAGQLEADPRAALVIYWRDQDRQVRVRGAVRRLAEDESDRYFSSRARESRLGAWASPQSESLPDRESLDRRLSEVERRFAGQAEIPRPEFWGGYLLRPVEIEFWQGQQARLHDRFRYTRVGGGWRLERLAP
jgi:pyridoxamine 5'-phosphate oxidase